MKKRYIVYACVILLVALSFVSPPVLPVIQLPGEVVVPWPEGSVLNNWFGHGLTNTFIATILTFLILVGLTFSLRARSRTAEEVPTGFYNFFEMIIEFAYGYVENAAGKWARNFFPFFMTFILWIVVANWMELVPGVDAIGKWEDLSHLRAEQAVMAAEKQAEAEGRHLSEEEIHHIEEEALHEADEANLGDLKRGFFLIKASTDENGEKPDDADWTIVPFVRAAATDLNFPLALAIISVLMTQYYGMKAQGLKYWKKFFVWDGDAIAKNPLAIMDPAVGILEFISEIFKIVSFAFRLLGNIFAGQVLLFVIAALVPVANLLFWHLEFAVGILQAAVFALLTLTFMTGATESHHGEEHH
ncbi:MAG: F0F1 ATP synthase subunit A [Chloroflexi bacterium]|nr:MAG: F0F1 ATP synthase subunit A [Chloroflexota bacterium]